MFVRLKALTYAHPTKSIERERMSSNAAYSRVKMKILSLEQQAMGDVKIQRDICASAFHPALPKKCGGECGSYGYR